VGSCFVKALCLDSHNVKEFDQSSIVSYSLGRQNI
jgi:hypothetical protein